MTREPLARHLSNTVVDAVAAEGNAHNNSPARRSTNKRHQTSNATLGVQPSVPAISPAIASHGSAGGHRPLNMQPSVPALTPAQMYSNFEEWIKMCTDNKVNSTNTWNFALIDYFHEMTFLKEGDSINFQKASCTLDGCVKIYTSRVDSVANETGKLLSGLADSNTNGDGEDDSGRQSGERRTRKRTNRSEATLLKDFSSIAIKKFDLDFAIDPLFKKTSADFDEGGARGLLLNHLGLDQHCKIIFDASDATIEVDLEELDGEHSAHAEQHGDDQESEANVAADRGADKEQTENSNDLTNGEEQADDIMDADEIEEEKKDTDAMDIDDEDIKKQNEGDEKDALRPIEIARLKSKLPKFEALPNFHIVPFLKGYNFFADDDNEMTVPDLNDMDMDEMMQQNQNANPAPADNNYTDIPEDAFHFDDAGEDAFGMDFADIGDDVDPFDTQLDFNSTAGAGGPDGDHADQEGEQQPSAAGVQHQNKSLTVEHDFLSALIRQGEDKEMLDYFDSALKKNWAGPEHWKLRRPITSVTTKPSAATTDITDGNSVDGASTTGKTKRKTKVVVDFSIPFSSLLQQGDDDDEEVERDSDGEVIDGVKEDEYDDKHTFEPLSRKPIFSRDMLLRMTDHQLPDDIQFTSKLLLQYSLKPALPNKPRNRFNHKRAQQNSDAATAQNDSPAENEDPNNPDINFWANQGHDYGEDIDYDMPTDNYYDEGTQISQTMLTAFEDTSFAHAQGVDTGDDLFENNDDDALDAETAKLYGDELITSHSLKKTKPLYVNYARQAKRVDVKKLKDNLWKVLTTTVVTTDSSKSSNETREEPADEPQQQQQKKRHYMRTDSVQGVQKFTDIVHNLKRLYSPKTMKDISVPFCFICLLHLANEKDLSIQRVQKKSEIDHEQMQEGNDDDDDFVLGGDGDGSADWLENLNEIIITQN